VTDVSADISGSVKKGGKEVFSAKAGAKY